MMCIIRELRHLPVRVRRQVKVLLVQDFPRPDGKSKEGSPSRAPREAYPHPGPWFCRLHLAVNYKKKSKRLWLQKLIDTVGYSSIIHIEF